ncbi:hypothetical protein E0I61_13850 [Flavobacterium ranwuense]|uniref:Lipoprotein n=1 Tax=Flavobacterium ranwuense TaxID=2541725 RepID=A0ABY2DNW6_9FLAO|nr:hypothetical protein [Flavobacterium ranwuense]TDE27789.1 hypothetical protein E0I61_13850 [Flavobacterium ranwuense]
MKKLLVLLVSVVFVSCSQDQVESTDSIAETSSSFLDGKLLSYKDDKSFIKEYSALSELKSTKEIKGWISKKGHTSLLNTSIVSEGIQDSIIDNTRIIYSDALKAIVNDESKFKINGKVLWLNGINLYELNIENKDKNSVELIGLINDLKIYGSVFNANNKLKKIKESSTSRLTMPNVNGSSVTYMNSANDKRYYMVVFNETIIVNGVSSSKMYLRASMTYKSCSFWRCTYKEDTTTGRFLYFNVAFVEPWYSSLNNGYVYQGSGTQTILLATMGTGPFQSFDFNMDGNLRMQVSNGFDWTQTF